MDGARAEALVSVSNRDSEESDGAYVRRRPIGLLSVRKPNREDVGVFSASVGPDGFCREADATDFSGRAVEGVGGKRR